jgi:prepilin-type N-terminal cleavage/methylation domain-containing protein
VFPFDARIKIISWHTGGSENSLASRLNKKISWTLPKAFTLIELLVVVAIIGILAIIAIHNLVEAQTRSKVSRVISDMRVVALGIESARIDNNRYLASTPDDPFLIRLIPLTTPIAYIEAIPEDVFLVGMRPSFAGPVDWASAFKINGVLVHPFTFEYFRKLYSFTDTSSFSSHNIEWSLKSAGPDGIPMWFGTPQMKAYDPTNGTNSEGEILFSGPGNILDRSQKN